MKTSILVILFFLCSQLLSQIDDRDNVNHSDFIKERVSHGLNTLEQMKHSLEYVNLLNEEKTIINKTVLGNGFLLVENIRENWDGTKWIYNYMFAWIYDGNDNIIEYSFYRWGGSGSDVDWTANWKITYLYDGNDNNIQWIYSNWDGSNWIDNGMSTNRYDENDNKIEETFQMWNGSAWVLAHRHTYAYDGKNMIEDIRENWDGSALVLAQKNTYTYDGKKMIENLSQMWNGSWVNEQKNTYTFDENDNRIEALYQIWYISDWANKSRNLYQYDGKKITEDLSQSWGASDWDNKSKKTFTYNENKEMIEYLSQDWIGSDWVNKSKNTYAYDVYNNKIEDFFQLWIGSDWVIQRKHTYAYDVNNNKIEDLSEQWNGSDWVNIERDIYRYSSAPEITKPTKGDTWISGQEDTIKWVGGIEGELIKIKYSSDGGSNFELIVTGISVKDSMYIWDIPDDLFSTKSIIRIERNENIAILAESKNFKIKPYIITKLDDDGNYIPYDSTYWWGFSNNETDVWPQTYWQNFDYTGIDPITNKIYCPYQGDGVFAEASPSDHPDWMSFVGAFGVQACYFDISRGFYSPKALLLWKAKKGNWLGSCFGLAISNALAFEKKKKFSTVYPDFPDINTPILVNSDANVVKTINELFTHQFGNPHEANLDSLLEKTPHETLNDLKNLLKEDDVKIRTLSFLSNDPDDPGGHAIVGYKIERDEEIDHIFYIYVYDNAIPDAMDARVIIDTSANEGRGSWSTEYAWQDWGGDKYLFLEDTASTFFVKPVLPKKANRKSPFNIRANDLQIFTSALMTPLITDGQGNQTGIGSSGMVIDIPGSYPLIKRNGSSGPPYGYYLIKDNYSIIMNNFEVDTINVFFLTGNKLFEYERYGATQTQTDRLFFDGGITVTNPDSEQKRVKLLNIISDTTSADEKLFLLRSLNLSQNDSVKIINTDNNNLDLISYGSQKDYQIELNYASTTGFGRFLNDEITLAQNTTHKLVPNWGDYADLMLTIYVDEGNNGTIDDTLEIQNQVTGVREEQGSVLPTEYRLEQNYPNPFNNSTIIRYSILKEGIVTLKIYNAIGEEVTTIVNELKQPGNYEATFSTKFLTSGVYFYRIQAGEFVDTKKMILLK